MPNRYLEWAEPIPERDSPHSEAGRVPPAWAKPMVCRIVRGKDGDRKRKRRRRKQDGEGAGGKAQANCNKVNSYAEVGGKIFIQKTAVDTFTNTHHRDD